MKTIANAAAGALALAATAAHGAWTLDDDASRVSFVSVKKTHVAEVHRFETLHGGIGPQGRATLAIDLASVDTGIPIRDERMGEMLFQTGLFPRATFTTRVDPRALRALGAGQSRAMTVEGRLDLHGAVQPVTAEVVVTRLTRGRIQVSTLEPVLVDAGAHDLVQGVERLREVAGLPSISHTVPVTFTLTFLR